MKAKLRKGSKGPMVQILKTWLNTVLEPSPGLTVNRTFDQATHNAVFRFESENGFHPADGVTDAATWAAIGKKVGPLAFAEDHPDGLPTWLWNFILGQSGSSMNFDRGEFFSLYFEQFGGLSPKQLAGLETLLTFLEDDPEVNDVRWAAYMLATVKLECANTWQPIKEGGCVEGRDPVCTPYKGKDGKMHDRLYGNPKPCPNLLTKPPGRCPAGKTEHHYYGRGYVQLTHQGNYAAMSTALLGNDDLVHSPERVMEPEVAYRIMSYGMRHGSFRSDTHIEGTGKHKHKAHTPYTLARYIHGKVHDYYHARNIINGVVPAVAKEIADNAKHLEAILTASLLQPVPA
jgi:putative chitinase